MKHLREYKLPNGKTTTDVNAYAKAWGDMLNFLSKYYDCPGHSMNPGFMLTGNGKTIEISCEAAFKLKKKVMVENRLKRRLKSFARCAGHPENLLR